MNTPAITRRLRQDLATWFTAHDHALDYLTIVPGTYLIDDGLGDLRPTDGILYTFVTADQCEYRVTVPTHAIDHALSKSADAAVEVIATAFLAKFGATLPAPTETMLELPDPEELDAMVAHLCDQPDYTTPATHVVGYGLDDHLGEYTDKATLRRIPGTTPTESATFITLLIIGLCIIAMFTLAATTH